jgi:hypothetical protein
MRSDFFGVSSDGKIAGIFVIKERARRPRAALHRLSLLPQYPISSDPFPDYGPNKTAGGRNLLPVNISICTRKISPGISVLAIPLFHPEIAGCLHGVYSPCGFPEKH